MNHTIKSIILVAVITSMLFVGATSMFPILQNSFAHKKSDFKGADPDPNTNTNSNTNSADSSSSSSATADNTNNINNTATASSNQNQNACAVAVTCPEGSTTVTSTPPPPPTGTLTISKVCALSNPCPGTEYHITVTGTNPITPSSFTLSDHTSQPVTLGPGSFTVHESVPTGFDTPFFEGPNCVQTDPNSSDATGTISAGQNLHCTIINSD
jgi:cytoskeletal protein RodZ